MPNQTQQLRGFSLLELLLVLIILAAILLFGFNRYQIYQQQRNLAAIRENIELLLQANRIYYHLHCRADTTFAVSIDTLKQAGLLPNLIEVSFANNYAVAATEINKTTITKKPIYQLEASVTLNVPATTLPFYAQQLNATSIEGNQLIWQRLPNYSITSTESDLWIARTGLHQFKEMSTDIDNPTNPDNSCAY